MPDELSMRKPTFAPESAPVTLADGNIWYFPKPVVSLVPVVANGKRTGLASKTNLGTEFDALVAAVETAEDGGSVIAAVYDVAIFMLSKNYMIPDELYPELLRFTASDDASKDMLMSIMDVARGNGPKRSTDGGG